jgi:hypothetical protein
LSNVSEAYQKREDLATPPAGFSVRTAGAGCKVAP